MRECRVLRRLAYFTLHYRSSRGLGRTNGTLGSHFSHLTGSVRWSSIEAETTVNASITQRTPGCFDRQVATVWVVTAGLSIPQEILVPERA